MIYVPVKNIEAEKSLIGSLLLNNKYFEDCEHLVKEDFYKSANGLIFDIMLSLRSKGQKVDAESVWFEITKAGQEQKAESPHYLVDIMENSPLFNVKKYAEIIKDCSLTRSVKNRSMNIFDSALTGEELLSLAQSAMLEVQATTNLDDIKNLGDIVSGHLDRLSKAHTTEEGLYYKTGFPRIDKCLKLKGPKLVIIAGRPGAGKTALACTMTKNLDRQGVCAGFLSIEMPEAEIIDRWLSMESGVDSGKFGKYNGFQGKDLQNIGDAAALFYQSKIKIDGTGCLDIVDVERKCRKMKKDGVQIVFIDQLSQIGNRKIKSGEETAKFSENCFRLARLKKELGIPIVVLAQLNRDMKNRGNKEPIISDLKQSGKIEEDADIIIFVHRPEEYADEKDKEGLKGIAVLNIAKNRSGPKLRDPKITFDHKTTYFYQGEEWEK